MKNLKEFESKLDIDKTLNLCREMTQDADDVDEDDIIQRPEDDPFRMIMDNPQGNDDVMLAALNKLGPIAKNGTML